MEVTHLLAQIDAEIIRLQTAKAAIASIGTEKPTRGRPKGSKNSSIAAPTATPTPAKAKRKLSPEGRKRIAEAQKKRWAASKKATAK